MTAPNQQLTERLAAVQSDIARSARAAGRAPEELTTIVVTKFHSAQLVRELAALGVRNVGENRHQEAAEKQAELSALELTWHFLGQIQRNKVRHIMQYANVLHSVDRVALVNAIPSELPRRDCFVQVNLTNIPARGGVAPADLLTLAERVLEHPALNLLGIMAVAPLEEEPAAAFERLRGYSDALRGLHPAATAISAGMSQDFHEAIAAGATHLRIGTAITGKRSDNNYDQQRTPGRESHE